MKLFKTSIHEQLFEEPQSCSNLPHSHPSFAQLLCTLVMTILQQANQAQMQSIAIPAIGTGNLQFPHKIAAKLMYETVIKFSQQNPQSSLVDIRFVLYHKDKPTIQVYF